ncbi:hypothetical protein YH62_15585 [Rhizobium sp. LC145]|nr:hypothetical protein YH62_15585 [Rhizobium sp. LC145]
MPVLILPPSRRSFSCEVFGAADEVKITVLVNYVNYEIAEMVILFSAEMHWLRIRVARKRERTQYLSRRRSESVRNLSAD